MQETKTVTGQSGKTYTCRRLTAQLPGICTKCSHELLGTEIWYAKGLKPVHVECPTTPLAPAAPAPTKRQVRTNKRADYCHRCGAMVPAGQGELFLVHDDDESMYGFQSGWLVEHLDRELCKRLREEAIARQAATEDRKRRFNREKDQLVSMIKAGEFPAHFPVDEIQGDRLLDTWDIYGAGDWFVLTSKYIWYVRNNGMDGDDWSRNNVPTGGAGAMGWRIPFDPEIAARIEALDALHREIKGDRP